MVSFLRGSFSEAIEEDLNGFEAWERDTLASLPETNLSSDDKYIKDAILFDPEYSAYLFLQQKKENLMARRSRRTKKEDDGGLPMERRTPVSDPWQYAYLLTGEKKIGKTSFAIEGCEEFVFQFDKPQLAYAIREEVISTWKESLTWLKKLEAAAESGDFPYQRIIIDGTAEWYALCQKATCRHFGISHPSEEGFAKGWHHLRDSFTDVVNRLLRLQVTAKCGIIFIAHAEWKEVSIRGGGKVDKLVPDLAGKCEEIVNGKVDGWFCYDYSDEGRVLVIRGDQTTGAGHRIDGRFLTPGGERINEIDMGNSSKEAMENFIAAFNNKQTYVKHGAVPDEKPARRKRKSSRK